MSGLKQTFVGGEDFNNKMINQSIDQSISNITNTISVKPLPLFRSPLFTLLNVDLFKLYNEVVVVTPQLVRRVEKWKICFSSRRPSEGRDGPTTVPTTVPLIDEPLSNGPWGVTATCSLVLTSTSPVLAFTTRSKCEIYQSVSQGLCVAASRICKTTVIEQWESHNQRSDHTFLLFFLFF